MSSQKPKRPNPIRTVLIVSTVSILAVVAFVVLAVSLASKDHAKVTLQERQDLANRYEAVQIPPEMKLESKEQGGDGLDSSPNWTYDYTITKDRLTSVKDLQMNLELQGFTEALDSTTNELVYESTDRKLQLRIRSTTKTISVYFVSIL